MDSPNLSLISYDEPPAAFAAAIDEGLGQANEAAAPLHEVRPLACAARLGDGTIIGGAAGRTWGLCCELQQLWVHPAHRRRRLGTRLVREFESAGKGRGCLTFYLETFNFQAPGLYAALGYEVAYEHAVYPHGIVRYCMVRKDDPRRL